MSFFSYHSGDASSLSADGWSSVSQPPSFAHAHMRSVAESPFAALTPFPSAAHPTANHAHTTHHATAHSHALSTAGLDAGNIVYRGMHSAEPTMFAQQAQPAWQDAYTPMPSALPSKKLDMSALSMAPSPVPAAVAYTAPAQQESAFDLPAAPQHVERYTSFYSASQPAAVCKALRIAFQTMTELRVEVTEEVSKAKFRGVCVSECGESISFVARVYRTAAHSAAPAPLLVEVQRRCGSSVDFYRLYQKLVHSCGSVCAAPFDSASKAVCGVTSFAPLPLPGFAAPSLDIPSALSLCSMAQSKYMDTRREASRCMLQCARQADLFPTAFVQAAGTPVPAVMPVPSLSRASSTRSTASNAEEASTALWAALVGLLQSADAECARLGASILRATFARKNAGSLLDALAADRALLATLLSKLAEARPHSDHDVNNNSPDALLHTAFKRELAHALAELAAKRGAATLNNVHPNATALLKQFV